MVFKLATETLAQNHINEAPQSSKVELNTLKLIFWQTGSITAKYTIWQSNFEKVLLPIPNDFRVTALTKSFSSIFTLQICIVTFYQKLMGYKI
jgi:hypothetical protein